MQPLTPSSFVRCHELFLPPGPLTEHRRTGSQEATPGRRRFDPKYGSVVTRVLPAIVGLMSVCGLVFLFFATSSWTGIWLALACFGIGSGYLGLYLWFLIYREIEFREDGIVVRRYLFPDVEGTYDDVSGVSTMGFRLDGYPVGCHTMENSAELQSILDDLRRRGVIEPADDGGLSRDFGDNLAATLMAGTAGVLVWLLVDWTDLAPASIPDGVAALGVILLTMLIGAPLLKRWSSD